MDEEMRIHVATFNAVDGESYNRENCELAQQLFQAQPEVETKFWCEKRYFQKISIMPNPSFKRDS